MKIVKKPWFLPVLFTCLIVVAGAFYIGSLMSKDELLSDSQIRAHLENSYGGTVDGLSLEKDIYRAEMTRNGAVYSAEIDAYTGKVLALLQLSEPIVKSPQILSEEEARAIIAKKYTGEIERMSPQVDGDSPIYEVEVVKEQELVVVIIDALTGEVLSETVQESTVENVLITKEKAIEIAQGQLQGEVEYVVFKQTDDGGYYLIEIEQDNDEGDDLEAVFQIHAVTGIIMSVDWDV